MILVTGATGFVGRELVAQALSAGHRVRALCRHPARARELWPQKSVELFHGNVLNPDSLEGALDGVEAVVHLVGIITEARENTYERVHRLGTLHVLDAAKKAKVKRYLHMSALGTRAAARSKYHKTKWAAEEAVRASGLDWTIFRPAVIFGKYDQSINLFARMLRWPLPFPIFGSGQGLWQPVPVEEVARCFVRAIREPKAVGRTYDLVGPTPLTFEQVLDTLMSVTGRRRPKLRVPMACARLQAALLERCEPLGTLFRCALGAPPPNRDQLLMLEENNVGDPTSAVSDLGLRLVPFEEGLRKYLP